jgi:hypothetical protein
VGVVLTGGVIAAAIATVLPTREPHLLVFTAFAIGMLVANAVWRE